MRERGWAEGANQVMQNVTGYYFRGVSCLILAGSAAGNTWYRNVSKEDAGTMIQHSVTKLFRIESHTILA